MTRSRWKNSFVHPDVWSYIVYNRLNKFSYKKNDFSKMNKIHFRNSTILPFMNKILFSIHNGRKWLTLRIKPHMFWYKFGDFFATRSDFVFKRKKKKKKKMKNKKNKK